MKVFLVTFVVTLTAILGLGILANSAHGQDDIVATDDVIMLLQNSCSGRETVGEDWDRLSPRLQEFALTTVLVCIDYSFSGPEGDYVDAVRTIADLAIGARMLHLHPEAYGLPNDRPGTIYAWPACYEDYSACWIQFYDSEAGEECDTMYCPDYRVLRNDWLE